MQGDRERCLDAGFDGYLAKPIRQAELEAALERSDSRHPRAAHGTDDGTDQAGPPARLLTVLEAACGGDDDFARELAGSFLESAPRCLDELRAQLSRSTIRGRWPSQAHGLKGISRTIGANDLAMPAKLWRTPGRRAISAAARPLAGQLDAAWE